MIGHHSHWFALNNILWLKHLRADKDAQDQKNNQQSPGARNKISPSVFRGVTIVRHGGIRAHISRGPRWYRVSRSRQAATVTRVGGIDDARHGQAIS